MKFIKIEMNQKKDAYGQEIWAYLNKKESYEIIEREDGEIGISGGAPNYFSDYKDWSINEKRAVKLAKGRILDIGVGAGRVALYLEKKGFKVTGIDNSPLAIKVCKKRGVKDARLLPIEQIGKFKTNAFDTVIMFGNNFGLFGSMTKAKRLLKIMHRITSPQALILAESNDIYKTKDSVHLAYHKLNRKRGRMPGQLRIRVRFRTYIGDWFDYLLVSKDEMNEVFKGTGWRVRKFINTKSPIYIAVIQKE